MLQSEEELYVVTELMENTGYWLRQEPANARRLRVMQERLSKLASSSLDANLVFLDYFLSGYVQRLWKNLAIDFTYESGGLGREVLVKLFKDIGEGLENLADALRSKDSAKYHDTLLKLTSAYRSSIDLVSEKEKVIREEKVVLGTICNPKAMEPEKRELYEVLEKAGAITQSEYTLASGWPSRYFFDIDRLLSKPEFVDTVSKYYSKEIEKARRETRIDKLAFIEKDVGTIGALPLMSSIVLKTGIDAFAIRLWKDVLIGRVKGSVGTEPAPGENIGLIGDVATTSKSLRDAAQIIRDYGAETPCAFVLFDREQGAKQILDRYKIHLRSIVTRSELERIGLIPHPSKDPVFDQDVIPPAEWKISRYSKGIASDRLEQEKTVRFGKIG